MSDRVKKANYIGQSGIRGTVSWVILALYIVKIIYMSYQTGMSAMTYYAYAEVVFVTGFVLFGISVVPVLKKMVFFQINHGNYKNTAKVYRVIEGMLLMISLILAVVLFFFSKGISLFLFKTKLCSLIFKIIAIALLCWILMSGLKGYMEGIGNAMPGIFADLTAHVLGLAVTIISQPFFSQRGREVAALMRQDAYAYAYAACSGALGLAIGGLAGLLFLLAVRTVFGKEIRRRVRSDEARKTDSAQDILWNFFGNYLKSVFTENVGVLLGIILFILYAHLKGNAADGAGMLYVGMVVLALPVALLSSQMASPFARQISAIMKQGDFHHAKERMSFYLKMLSYTVLPICAFAVALAPLMSKVFFDVEQEKLFAIIRIGMTGAALIAYGVFFRKISVVVIRPFLRHMSIAMLGVSGIIFLYVLKLAGMTGETGSAYAYVLACLLYVLLIAFLALKKIKIYKHLLECLVIPFVASLLSGAIVFGLYILMDGMMADILLLFVCGAILYIVYHAVICFLRIFEAHEWKEVPGSDLPVFIAKLMGKY